MNQTMPLKKLILSYIPIFAVGIFSIHFALNQVNVPNNLKAGDRIETSLGEIVLSEIDFTVEPGELDSNEKLQEFYQRQNKINHIIQDKKIFTGQRSVANIPWSYWVQLIVGIGAVLISGLIWTLRPKDLATIYFYISGLSTLLFTSSAAVYTTRSLAIDSSLFKFLVSMNVFGASLYGMSTISLFLLYPLKLGRWKILMLAQMIVFGIWTTLSLFGLLTASLGVNSITLVEMLLILVALVAQFVVTRKDLRARKAFRWLGLSVLIGAGSFIGLNALPLVLGFEGPWLDQGTAFLLFLLIYLGIAAGLSKKRLFEIDEWGLKLAYFACSAALVFMLDAFLVLIIGMSKIPSFGISIFAISFLYLPLRDVIWRKFLKKGQPSITQNLEYVLNVALAPTDKERKKYWSELIDKNFSPLELIEDGGDDTQVQIQDEGLALFIPAIGKSPAFRLLYARRGKNLFNREDERIASNLVGLLKLAESSRESYERGVLNERKRMAQDLHDDVGSRLLTAFHTADEKSKPTFLAAINDVRAIVVDLNQDRINLLELLANLRFETKERLDVHQIELDWPIYEENEFAHTLNYQQYKAISSSIKEVVSNVIKHSNATLFKFQLDINSYEMRLELSDNGRGITPKELSQLKGYGLMNIQNRVIGARGKYDISSSTSGTTIRILVPI